MDEEAYVSLFNCRKILVDKLIKLPLSGEQKTYDAFKINDERETFNVIVNRKGHLNPDNLTYLLWSRYGILIRIDMSGAPHEDVETPHVHIFDKEHDFGRKAIALSEITNVDLLKDIVDSFDYFLRYNKFEQYSIDSSLF